MGLPWLRVKIGLGVGLVQVRVEKFVVGLVWTFDKLDFSNKLPTCLKNVYGTLNPENRGRLGNAMFMAISFAIFNKIFLNKLFLNNVNYKTIFKCLIWLQICYIFYWQFQNNLSIFTNTKFNYLFFVEQPCVSAKSHGQRLKRLNWVSFLPSFLPFFSRIQEKTNLIVSPTERLRYFCPNKRFSKNNFYRIICFFELIFQIQEVFYI